MRISTASGHHAASCSLPGNLVTWGFPLAIALRLPTIGGAVVGPGRRLISPIPEIDLWVGVRSLDPRHREGAPHGCQASPARCGSTAITYLIPLVRWLQVVGMGTRDGPRRPGAIYPDQAVCAQLQQVSNNPRRPQ